MISKVTIDGFKSIRHAEVVLTPLNLMLGRAGCGKSNLHEVFELLDSIFLRGLSLHTAVKSPDALLYGGSSTTKRLSIEVIFNCGKSYSISLVPSPRAGLIIQEEKLNGQIISHGGSIETALENVAYNDSSPLTDDASYLLSRPWRSYRFQNTSAQAASRRGSPLADDAALHTDGSNLAAFLYRLRRDFPRHYRLLVLTIRLAVPAFDDFFLTPTGEHEDYIMLRWKEKGLPNVMTGFQLSDGTLRFITLAALLLQPEKLQPDTILIDEPELGMHPDAIVNLADLLKTYAYPRQVIISTQSVDLLDEFECENIIVVNKDEGGSHYDHIDPKALSVWLEQDISLGELWMRNIIGERPWTEF